MKNIITFTIILSFLLSLVACNNGNPSLSGETPEESNTSEKTDYAILLELLIENGFQYTEKKQERTLLSVERKAILIDDGLINVYEYESTQEMEKDSECISKDGFTITRPDKEVYLEWVSKPHFFKKDTLIINYVGENELLLCLLTENYGSEFAGYGYVDQTNGTDN